MKNKKSPTEYFRQAFIFIVIFILAVPLYHTAIKGKTILEFIDNIVNNWSLYCQTIFLAGTFGYSIASFREKSDEERNESRRNTIKTNFFNMVNYHYRMLDDLEVKPLRKKQENDSEKETTQERQPDSYKGRMAFTVYKQQLYLLLQAVKQTDEDLNDRSRAKAAYLIFTYGLDERWLEETKRIFRKKGLNENLVDQIQEVLLKGQDTEGRPFSDFDLGRTNQTFLGAYFRNMYNAIKLIDREEDPIFNDKEKEELIRIYRAQWSNPELYVMFFHFISVFEKEWEPLVNQYQLIQNLPSNGYLEGYDLQKFFKEVTPEYEEE